MYTINSHSSILFCNAFIQMVHSLTLHHWDCQFFPSPIPPFFFSPIPVLQFPSLSLPSSRFVVCHCGMLTLWQCRALNNWCVDVKVWCLTRGQIEPAGSVPLPISQLSALSPTLNTLLSSTHTHTHTHLSKEYTYLPVEPLHFFSQTHCENSQIFAARSCNCYI